MWSLLRVEFGQLLLGGAAKWHPQFDYCRFFSPHGMCPVLAVVSKFAIHRDISAHNVLVHENETNGNGKYVRYGTVQYGTVRYDVE